MNIELSYELIKTYHGTFLAFNKEDFSLKHVVSFDEFFLPILYCKKTNNLLIQNNSYFFIIKDIQKNFSLNLTHLGNKSKIEIYSENNTLIISKNNQFLRARKNMDENQFGFNDQYNTWEKFFITQ